MDKMSTKGKKHARNPRLTVDLRDPILNKRLATD